MSDYTSGRATMTSESSIDYPELIRRYEKWRRIYAYAGQPVPDEPAREDGRLNFRKGYPYEGWTAYILEPKGAGYQVLRATTERRNEPLEGLAAFFTNLEDAGKFIIWESAVGVRVALRLPSVSQAWRSAGLDPQVEQISLDKYVSKYELKDDPSRYFILQAGGVQPENRLLPLSYDELDTILLDGMPESITSQL